MGAGLLAPRIAFAQAARKVVVVVLFAGDSEYDEPASRPFFEEMRRLGWEEGKNISYERLSGRGTREYVQGLAQSAADLTPGLIYATTANIALAALKATDSVPVVFTSASDPVAIGLVKSLAKPGRNATGAHLVQSNVVPRRLALIREAFPGVKRIGVVLDRLAAEYERLKAVHEDAGRRAALELSLAEFTNFEAAVKNFGHLRREGITVAAIAPSFTLFARRREVSAAAARNRVALVAHRAEWAEAGALMSYGPEIADSLRRTARIADRILKGARPAEVPVEQATKSELVVNQGVAKALGLTLPKPLLQRADRVIE